MAEKMKFRDTMEGSVESGRGCSAGVSVYSTWEWECYGGSGRLKWSDKNHNKVVDQGLNKLLDIWIAGSSVASFATWKVGLVNGSSITPAAGWDYQGIGSDFIENTAYSGSRQAFTAGSVASQSVSNSGSKASFTITGSSAITVCGAFMASGPNAVTKGNAAAGNIIYAVSQFSSGAKTLDPADVLKCTITLTASNV